MRGYLGVEARGRGLFYAREFCPYAQMDNRLLSPGTVAYAIFLGVTPPECSESLNADNLVSSRGVKPHTEILEWPLPHNSYGHVLTLVYVKEGIAGWDEGGVDEEAEIGLERATFHKGRKKNEQVSSDSLGEKDEGLSLGTGSTLLVGSTWVWQAHWTGPAEYKPPEESGFPAWQCPAVSCASSE